MSQLPVVHAVTADDVILAEDFLPRAQVLMEALGGRGAIHLRGRNVAAMRLFELAGWLAGWERDTGCRLVVNDRVDVAAACGITAVHLTARSMSPADVRRVLPGARTGVSVHSADGARAAEESGADWCVAGPAFATASHPSHEGGGPGLIAAVVAATRLPVVAIGGITPAQVPEMLQAGAHGVAAIRGIWGSDDVAAAARGYLTQYDEHEGRS